MAEPNVEVVLLPRDLRPGHLTGRCVVVFDVLRATTSIAAALAAGVREIRVYDRLDAAARAAEAFGPGRLLAGEEKCLPPPGFDLGNSPAAFVPGQHTGRVMFMSTTNGTRAIAAARGAAAVLTGALVNADAVARAVTRLANAGGAGPRGITLLCAGTGGTVAMEDLLGAGAVIESLRGHGDVCLDSDVARVASRLFLAARGDLRTALSESTGGRNVIAAGLGADVDFCARLNVIEAVGVVADAAVVDGAGPPVVKGWSEIDRPAPRT